MDDLRYETAMRREVEEALRARDDGENPFGAILLDPDLSVRHAARSRCRELLNPTAHAEMLLIREYCSMHGLV